jgi:hypothetical protein
MLILSHHVVTVRTAHGFDLHLYFGNVKVPKEPYHVHERHFLNMVKTTHDPRRRMALMIREVDDALFE